LLMFWLLKSLNGGSYYTLRFHGKRKSDRWNFFMSQFKCGRERGKKRKETKEEKRIIKIKM